VPIPDIVSEAAQQKTPERFSVSPEGFPATYKLDQATYFRFLRQPSRPSAADLRTHFPRRF